MLEQNENRSFKRIKSIRINNILFDFSTCKVMGIINLTPDSFYDGGRLKNDAAVLKQAEKFLAEGASLLDLGAFSSRPGAKLISLEEEVKRLAPVLKLIRSEFSQAVISVDTYRAEIARLAFNEGANIINDISGGQWDEALIGTVSELGMPYVLMHTPAQPKNMQQKADYQNVVAELFQYFDAKIKQLRAVGIQDIIIDPGFGFGKLLQHNYQLLANLSLFEQLDCPLLVGISRKKMIQEVINESAQEALNATTAAHTIAVLNGANILRVHDVKEAQQAIAIVKSYQKFNIATV